MFYFLALPDQIKIYLNFPLILNIQRNILYILSGWWYIIICVPSLFSLYYLIFNNVGDIKEYANTKKTYKKIICILPIYNEDFELLEKGLYSIFNLDYPMELLDIHISFDDYSISDLFLQVLDYFQIECDPNVSHYIFEMYNSTVHIHRFPHGGKKHTQMNTWNIINYSYKNINTSECLILLSDSDNIIKPNALHNFTLYLHKNPSKLAYCGYMSCITSSDSFFITALQDTEYISCEINRFFELQMGTVNCLPGAFTIMRYTAFQKLSKEYFSEFEQKNITHYHQRSLGEDRYLTHLFHKTFPRNSIGFCPTARCCTDPPNTILKFIKQRRRWLLGAISNEAYMISTPVIWNKVPILMIYKVIQTAFKSTTFSQILVASFGIITTLNSSDEEKKNFMLSVLIPFGIAWFTAICFAYKLQHYKIFILWPFMIIFYTIIYIFVDYYTIFTWNKKTWGGDRTSNSEAEEKEDVV
jgi:chitin synthase